VITETGPGKGRRGRGKIRRGGGADELAAVNITTRPWVKQERKAKEELDKKEEPWENRTIANHSFRGRPRTLDLPRKKKRILQVPKNRADLGGTKKGEMCVKRKVQN